MSSNIRKIRNLSYLMIVVIITLLGSKFVFAKELNENYSYKQISNGDFYLNLDILNLNKQNVLFDINEIKPNLSQDKKINISLSYNTKSSYDIDNDGEENLRGVIDFSVSNTTFDWDVNKEKLCTRWEIYSIEKNSLTTICYGNDKCCKFISLEPSRSNWSEILYLTYGMYDAGENYIVSAQVIYVDYTIEEKPYSNVYYSKWNSLSAIFRDDNLINKINNISIEEALKNIEKLRLKNKKIKRIDLLDIYGNKVEELSEDKNISIVFNISKSSSNIVNNAKTKKDNEIIISLNDFNALSADWNKSDSIKITTENNKLVDSLKEIGITPKTVVSIKGIDDFLDEEDYDGAIRLSIEYFNSVIYCGNDTANSCILVPECLQELKNKDNLCYTKNNGILNVYVPHFSSIIIALDNSTTNLTINSPDNSSILQSGEDIYLNFTINETVIANYSMDNKSMINLGNGTSFTSPLNGTLPYGVLANGLHALSIYFRDILSSTAIFNYSFIVNDTTTPNVSINITNNTLFSGTSLILPVNISSNEYVNITYRINSNSFLAIDLGNKSKITNLSIANGSNNLTINSSDGHGNSNLNYFSFNFTLQTSSCSDAIQNGDETGIDCGGSCSACIAFNVTTDKPSYNLTDNVYITIVARANSTVNATVTRQNIVAYRHTFVPVFAGAPIVETRILSNTSNAGNYTINAVMYYLNITENKNVTFEVLAPSINPISVTINTNATTINEHDTVSFTSTVSGNNSGVAYKWDFQNDGAIDSTSASSLYTYTTNGTYTVNLTVTDSSWNQTDIETIIVKKLYNITVIVKDNATSNVIDNAEVEFDNELKNTSEGKAYYTKPADKYELVVKKAGYSTFSNKTIIENNAEIEVNLIEEDSKVPVIQLISPEDQSIISNNSVTFKYKAIDKDDMTCKLYLNTNLSLWKVEGINANVKSNTEFSFTLDLKNNTYQWQIECVDRKGNSNISGTYTFTVDTSLVENELSVDLNEEDKNAEGLMSQIDSIIASLDSLSAEEKEAAEAMQLRKILDRAKLTIERANRDLHSLKWRRLNESELEQETKTILDRIENAKETTPKLIEVVDKNEFVKYPNKEDVSTALEVFINTTNLKFTRKEFDNLVQDNHKIQSAMTVTTKVKKINVDYISGKKKTITLIQKIVNGEKNLSNLVFYEVIPKEIAKNISELELLFDYEIIDNDPIVSIDIEKIKEFSYYSNKILSIGDTENLKSILLNKDLKSEDKGNSLITGFFAIDAKNLLKTSDKRLIAEFVVIILLAVMFLYHKFDSEKFMYLFNGKEVNEIKKSINLALKDIANNDYEKASLKYKEINLKFNNLKKKKKDIIKGFVVELINKINLLYIHQLVEKANNYIKSNDKKEANLAYSKIQSLYKIVPKSYKAEVAKKCLELNNKLNIGVVVK